MKTLYQYTTCNCMLHSVQLEVETDSKLYINDMDYTIQLIWLLPARWSGRWARYPSDAGINNYFWSSCLKINDIMRLKVSFCPCSVCVCVGGGLCAAYQAVTLSI